MQCRFSPLAERDLEEIGDYIALDNPKRALRFIAEIRDRCFLIEQTPYASPLRKNLGTGVRIIPFGRYMIFYTIHEDLGKIRIERVLHTARDIDPSFFH
jgi:toxin ParE1/3/4